jgi:hypothetical protein
MIAKITFVEKTLIIKKTLGVKIVQPVQISAVRAPGNDHSSNDKGGRKAEPHHGRSLPNGAETSQSFRVSVPVDPVHLFAKQSIWGWLAAKFGVNLAFV